MVFGFGKSSHQIWTPGSYPGPPMLVTGVPTYSFASPYPYYSYAPQPLGPMIVPMMSVSPPVQTIPVPVPVACTGIQPVPSPVIYAPVAMPPANPSPARAPRTPRPRPPLPPSDAGNALMLVHGPQQAPQSSPSTIIMNFHLATPQQQPMQLDHDAVVQNQNYPPDPLNVNPPIMTRPPAPSPDVIPRSFQDASGTTITVGISPLPGMSPHLAPRW